MWRPHRDWLIGWHRYMRWRWIPDVQHYDGVRTIYWLRLSVSTFNLGLS